MRSTLTLGHTGYKDTNVAQMSLPHNLGVNHCHLSQQRALQAKPMHGSGLPPTQLPTFHDIIMLCNPTHPVQVPIAQLLQLVVAQLE